MADVVTGELIEADKVERHNALKLQLVKSLAHMCMAMHSIREEKTYTAVGCKSFGEFLKREGINNSTGRLYANSGPVLQLLVDQGDAELVKHIDMLRPIHKMQNPQVQAKVLRIASAVARQRMEPFTMHHVQEVAEKNFGWVPDSKRREQNKRKRADGMSPEEKQRREVHQTVQAALTVLHGLTMQDGGPGLTAFDLRQLLGPADQFIMFTDVLTLLQDWRDSE